MMTDRNDLSKTTEQYIASFKAFGLFYGGLAAATWASYLEDKVPSANLCVAITVPVVMLVIAVWFLGLSEKSRKKRTP
jgi:hypothetical protein